MLIEKLVKDLKDYCAFEGLLSGYIENYAIPVPWRSFQGREHKRDLEVLAHMQWNCPDMPQPQEFQVDLMSSPWRMRLDILRYLLAISVYLVNSYDSKPDKLSHTFMAAKPPRITAESNWVALGIKINTDQVEECPICLEEICESRDLAAAMYATTNCGHRFHQSCFGTWTAVAPRINCPSCRASIH